MILYYPNKQAKGFTVSATPKAPYSIDANMMHISYESGVLEDPMAPAPDGMLQLVAPRDKWPGNSDQLLIHFKAGVAIKVQNEGTKDTIEGSVQIFQYLNQIGGRHGVGVIDITEDRFIGMKSRGVYETPAGTILFEAVRDLEVLCLDREVNKIRSYLASVFSEKVYNGLWYSPEGSFVRSCLSKSQELVNGVVRMSLYQGRPYVVGRRAEKSLYDQELVRYAFHSS